MSYEDCKRCSGNGVLASVQPNGTGQRRRLRIDGHVKTSLTVHHTSMTCPDCGGTGYGKPVPVGAWRVHVLHASAGSLTTSTLAHFITQGRAACGARVAQTARASISAQRCPACTQTSPLGELA